MTRPPTLKLTQREYQRLAGVVGHDLGDEAVYDLIELVLGEGNAARLLLGEAPDRDITKADTIKFVKGVAELHPGDRTQDIAWAVSVAERTFETPERAAEVIAFARARIEEYEQAREDDAPAGDVLDGAEWGPKKEGNPSKARIVCRMFNLKYDGKSVTWDDDKPLSWPRKRVSSAIVNGVLYVAVKRDGKWFASKFDWLRSPDQESKGLENIHAGYDGLRIQPGEAICFVFASIDGRERSSASEIVIAR